jgi:hypothetical protein
MDPFQPIVLGVVQGLTEFLPVSSSGHLVLANYWSSAGATALPAVRDVRDQHRHAARGADLPAARRRRRPSAASSPGWPRPRPAQRRLAHGAAGAGGQRAHGRDRPAAPAVFEDLNAPLPVALALA